MFVLLGATASAAGQLLREHLRCSPKIAGIVIIVMGLHFLGVFKFAFLNREKRYQHASRPAGLIGAYAVGLAFAFGWTPCIGPVLAIILAVAASEESVAKGAGLLAIYSAGLGVPFLLSAVGGRPLPRSSSGASAKHLGAVEKVMGALLVLAGVAVPHRLHPDLLLLAARNLPGLPRIG